MASVARCFDQLAASSSASAFFTASFAVASSFQTLAVLAEEPVVSSGIGMPLTLQNAARRATLRVSVITPLPRM